MTDNKNDRKDANHRFLQSNRNWTGVLFIILGVFLLLQKTQVISEIDNWWALFVFVPGIATFIGAFQQYTSNRVVTIKLIARITSGTIITFVGLILLLSWRWGKIWPVFLIIIGIEHLLKNYVRNGNSTSKD
ncbi:MAG: hypothetical protein ACE5D7_04480 [Fidelibacterota bacterium]